MIVGHVPVVAALFAALPPVTLLQGPRSVGKWTIARAAAREHGIDGLMLQEHPKLRADDARGIVEFVGRRSHQNRAVVVALDDATDEAQNAMLKVLEEPPERTHFLLVSSRRPMLTITSRAQTFRCGYLTDEQVVQILVAKGIDEDKATEAARCSRGTVRPALEMAESAEHIRTPVLSALRAVAIGDEDLFWASISGKRLVTLPGGKKYRTDVWGDVQWELLRRWAVEALTGHWRTFSPSEGYGLQRDPRVAQRILSLPTVRPRVGVEAALVPVLVGRRLVA